MHNNVSIVGKNPVSGCEKYWLERELLHVIWAASLMSTCFSGSPPSIIVYVALHLWLVRPGRGAEYCDQPVCLSVCVCLSVREHISGTAGPIFTNFVRRSPVAVARSSYGGVALRYVPVLPVLWLTSRLAVMGATPKRQGCSVQRRPWAAWRYRGGVWCLWMFVCYLRWK